MAAPQQVHVRAAPLARALRTRVAAAAASASSPERALLGLSEPDLRQLAVDLGQVLSHASLPYPASSIVCPAPYCCTRFLQQSYRGKQLHDLLYKSRAKQIQEFSHGNVLKLLPGTMHATCLLFFSEPSGS